MQKKVFEDIKKTIVFIGLLQKTPQNAIKTVLQGTGFLMRIQNFFHLVTAKHVVAEVNPDTGAVIKEREFLHVFNNHKNGQIRFSSLDQVRQNYSYFYPDKDEVDIAIIPFPLDAQNDDVKVFAEDMFLEIEGIYETNEVFYLSYQPNISEIEKDKKVYPITRKGMVSRINDNQSLYIDGSAFPGNSGSPVFMFPSAVRISEEGNFTIGGDKLGGKFLGIIGSYIPYQDIAFSKQTGRARVIFEENTGLSQVWAIDHIKAIIESQKFKDHIENLQKNEPLIPKAPNQ